MIFACLLILFIMWTGDAEANEKLKVISTVSPITNIVQNIVGDRINIHGLIPEGVDSHTFEPAPGDIKYIIEADLIILNGLHLEAPVERLILTNRKGSVRILRLGDKAINREEWIFDFSFPREKGDPNPHLWLDVQHAIRYAGFIRDELMNIDPANADYYKKRAAAYIARLERLDMEINAAVKTIPLKNRRLLTYHDSWDYFGRRYGMRIIGAIQPSNFAEPSPRDVARLIDQIRAEGLPAIFGSEVYPSKVLDQIAREAGVRVVTTLRDDALPGDPGAKDHSYIGMMLDNVRNIVLALGGDAKGLDLIDPADIRD
ncbi:MAG: metal ABC transporter substrate-binding protein [Nitrospirota bacterium]